MAHRAKTMDEQKTKKYTREQLREAVSNILNGSMTVAEAHEEYHIPKRTLTAYVR